MKVLTNQFKRLYKSKSINLKMNDIMLPEINGDKVTFISIYKNEFNNWNLKDQIILTPQDIDGIPLFYISKIKLYNEKPIENHFLVKIEQTKKDHDPQIHLYAVSAQNHRFFYEKVFLYKIASMELQFDMGLSFNGSIQDDILKKSQFLKKWEERHVKITLQDGLTSKKLEKEKDSLRIKQTKEIWSRFQLVENKRFVVMKCKYLLGKEEFAIPVTKCAIWIRAFYTLFNSL